MDANRNAFMILLCVVLLALGGEDSAHANSYEVYIAHVDTRGWTGIQGQIPYWFVLFDDGEIYYDLPSRVCTAWTETGSRRKTGKCGAPIRRKAAQASLPEGYPNEPIEIDAQGQIVFRGDRYRRLAPVDFKRLEGHGPTISYAATPLILSSTRTTSPLSSFTGMAPLLI